MAIQEVFIVEDPIYQDYFLLIFFSIFSFSYLHVFYALLSLLNWHLYPSLPSLSPHAIIKNLISNLKAISLKVIRYDSIDDFI